MNYYQRIQRSIDFVENNLDQEISIETCAQQAYMSVSGFYRMFFSLMGCTVKEYIRKRRLTVAFDELMRPDETVLSIAIKYEYNSPDSFTRAFKKQFGILPSKVNSFSLQYGINKLGRSNLMEQYFEETDKELAEKYPDIKVIKKLEDIKVACFTYYGKDPEGHAFEALKKWTGANGINSNESAYRVFGYNHPDPANCDDAEEIYGYEVCVTISDEQYVKLSDVPNDFVKGTYDEVKRRVLKGGKYAVMSVKRDQNGDIGSNIIDSWKRLNRWVSDSKYIWGKEQYLEEHLGFTEVDGNIADHIGGVDLYVSLMDVPNDNSLRVKEVIPPCRVVVFRVDGNDGDRIAGECWGKALQFAKQNQLDDKKCKVYQYTKGFDRRPPLFHVVMITLPDEFDENNCVTQEPVKFDTFSGGNYATVETTLEQLGNSWMSMEKWSKETKAGHAKQQWVEEWTLENWSFPYKKIKVFYPIP